MSSSEGKNGGKESVIDTPLILSGVAVGSLVWLGAEYVGEQIRAFGNWIENLSFFNISL